MEECRGATARVAANLLTPIYKLTVFVITGLLLLSCESPLLQRIRAAGLPTAITVTFNSQGGSDPHPFGTRTVSVGEAYGELPTTERTGYSFSGWWTDSGGTGQRIEPDMTVTVSGNHTLYSKWEPRRYTVTFDAQEGSTPIPLSKDVYFDSPYGILPSVSRGGYEFGGWWTSVGGPDGGGTLVSQDTILKIDDDHHLFAYWSTGQFRVGFQADGGTPPLPAHVLVVYGGQYGSLATTTREGYSFQGWRTAPSGEGALVVPTTIVTIPGDHSLYAHWDPNTYEIVFHAPDGSRPDPESKNVEFGSAYGPLPTTSRTGYDFIGWFTEAAGSGISVTPDVIVTIPNDHTLHANWDPHSYIVTFDEQGGTTPNPPSTPVVFESEYGPLATTSRDGYDFAGWWTERDGKGNRIHSGTSVTSNSDHTLFAYWMPSFDMIAVYSAGLRFPTGRNDDGERTLSYNYQIAETEVTWRLWKTVHDWATDEDRGSSRYYFQNPGRMGSHDSGMNDLHPATTMNWRDAIVWTNALTEWYNFYSEESLEPVYRYTGLILRDSRDANWMALDNASQSGNGFRLPTHHEWELAARWRNDVTMTVHGFGFPPWFTIGRCASHARGTSNSDPDNDVVAWYQYNTLNQPPAGIRTTQPVKGKISNSLGLYDMSGNVNEYCFPLVNGYAIARGGSWNWAGDSLEIGRWNHTFPSLECSGHGIRLARPLN